MTRKEIIEELKRLTVQIEPFTILEDIDLIKLERAGFKDEESETFSIAVQYALRKYGKKHVIEINSKENDEENGLSIAVLAGEKYLAHYPGTQKMGLKGRYIGTLRFQRLRHSEDPYGHIGFQPSVPHNPTAETETMHIHMYDDLD